jgi:hypothetical protein
MNTRWLVLAAVLLATGLAAADTDPGVQFRDVTRESGITFRHTYGDERFSKILKATGSGVGVFDYDGDGDLDLYFVNCRYLPEVCRIGEKATEKEKKAHEKAKKENSGATNRLYRNDGRSPETGTLRFTDVTEKAGVGDNGYGMGCVVGDYDNDGDVDLYVTNYGPNVLYRNNGNGTFADVTAKAGVAGPEKIGDWVKWSTNAVLVDYDRDGYLDLWVCNYLGFDPEFDDYYKPEGFPGPSNYEGQASHLYRNRGDGTFEDVSEKAGILTKVAVKDGNGMGAAAADFNEDGWPDVYEANDAVPNFLWVNQGDGTFKEMGLAAECASAQGGEGNASMHPSIGDYDNDGLLDIFIPDMTYFSLYRNGLARAKGVLLFDNVTYPSGIPKAVGQFVGWGGFFFDYDNDGWLDIFTATGEAHRPENEPNLVLRNLANGKFEDVSLELGERVFSESRLSRGAATGDLDNDGDLDLVVVNLHSKRSKGGLPTILLNDGGNARSWIQIRLRGTRSNRDGIGAKVRISAGPLRLTDEARSAPSYLSSTEARMHFGLGGAKRVDRLEIDWPSGAKQILENVTVNQLLTVKEPAKKEPVKKEPVKKGGK